MFIVVVAALLGIWRFRTAEYFRWLCILFAWMLAAAILFWGGGTLEDPSGDGLITRQIRQATSDGPEMGIFAIIFLALYWGSAIFFITRLVRAARKAKTEEEAAYDDPAFVGQADNTNRKAVETLVLLIAAGIWIWFFFLRPTQARVEQQQSESTIPTPQQLTLEQQVMGAAAEVNATTPTRLKDMVLERATASGRTLTYHYRTDVEASPDEIRSFIRREVLPQVCVGDMRRDMKAGVSYAYSYTIKGRSNATSMVINEQTCAQNES